LFLANLRAFLFHHLVLLRELAQVWATISKALLVLSAASRAKRRHSAARLLWSSNLDKEPSALRGNANGAALFR
jgi:hypothetical protein